MSSSASRSSVTVQAEWGDAQATFSLQLPAPASPVPLATLFAELRAVFPELPPNFDAQG
jgi:hypothetical protein